MQTVEEFLAHAIQLEREAADRFAKEFVEDESGHVAELNRWIAARAAGQRMPAEA